MNLQSLSIPVGDIDGARLALIEIIMANNEAWIQMLWHQGKPSSPHIAVFSSGASPDYKSPALYHGGCTQSTSYKVPCICCGEVVNANALSWNYEVAKIALSWLENHEDEFR